MKPQEQKDFQKVVQSAFLREVTLISSQCECRAHHSLLKPENILLDFQKTVDANSFPYKDKENAGDLFSYILFAVTGKTQKTLGKLKKNDLIFSISAQFVAHYEIQNIKDLNKTALKKFGEENGFFNVYPFLREFISQMSLRLNIPPIFIPLLKPQILATKSKKK